MKIVKLIFVVVSLPLGVASYQAQAANYVYNSQNQMVRIDNHQIQYSPSGKLAQADSLKFIGHEQIQGSITSTRFGGVILRSDGTYDTTFMDEHNTPKSSSGRAYSDPYGNHKPLSLDIHNNRQVFGGGYSLFGATYMGARWYFPELRHFGAQDTYNVGNRFNLDKDNPIMNYDPSGHMSKRVRQGLEFGLLAVASAFSYGISFAFGGLIELGETTATIESIEGEEAVNEYMQGYHESGVPKGAKELTDIPKEEKLNPHANHALWAGYTVSNIIPAGITSYQKATSGASVGNTIGSVLIPMVAGALGTHGMLMGMADKNLQAAIFGGIDNAIEGAAYPIMQRKDLKVNPTEAKEMVAGLFSGFFAGVVGAKYSSIGLKNSGNRLQNYGKALGAFGARGATMEAGRQGVYGVLMTLMDKKYRPNMGLVAKQILVNSPIQMVEVLIMKPFMSGTGSKTATTKSIAFNAFFSSSGGGVMQFGSPLIDSMIS